MKKIEDAMEFARNIIDLIFEKIGLACIINFQLVENTVMKRSYFDF